MDSTASSEYKTAGHGARLDGGKDDPARILENVSLRFVDVPDTETSLRRWAGQLITPVEVIDFPVKTFVSPEIVKHWIRLPWRIP